MTLRQLLAEHPEWADLPIVVHNGAGYDFIGGAGLVYEDDTEDDGVAVKVLVFAAN